MTQPYRPANGTDGMIFMEQYCYHCTRDRPDPCPILTKTYFYEIEDPEYPPEWIYGDDGKPTCTAFEAMGGK